MPSFRRPFHARWGDTDFNAHMRKMAYLDMAADVRMMYYEELRSSSS
jgi:acyl-CoA thioester hydrolase